MSGATATSRVGAGLAGFAGPAGFKRWRGWRRADSALEQASARRDGRHLSCANKRGAPGGTISLQRGGIIELSCAILPARCGHGHAPSPPTACAAVAPAMRPSTVAVSKPFPER